MNYYWDVNQQVLWEMPDMNQSFATDFGLASVETFRKIVWFDLQTMAVNTFLRLCRKSTLTKVF